MSRRVTVTRRRTTAPRTSGTVALLAVGTAGALLANSGTAVAAENDSIIAEVVLSVPVAAEACISVPLDGILFRTGGEPTPLTSPTASNNVLATFPTTVTNCSTGTATFLGRVTAASGTTAAWDPYDPFTRAGGAAANICTHGPDLFRLASIVTDDTPPSGTFLTTTDRNLNGADGSSPVAAGGTRSVNHELTMPCEGSSGADAENVSFTIHYTAALAP